MVSLLAPEIRLRTFKNAMTSPITYIPTRQIFFELIDNNYNIYEK